MSDTNEKKPIERHDYYASIVKRQNWIKEYVLYTAVSIASYPRLLLEIFIRRQFGERYFSLASVITATILLLAYPLHLEYNYGHFELSTMQLIGRHFVWYLFTALFLGFGIKRAIEVERGPKAINLAWYSMCHGLREKWFINIYLRLLHYWPSPKVFACYLEPLPFLLLGMLLTLIHTPLGLLLIGCSILYSLGYMGEYRLGTHALLNMTDRILMEQENAKILIEDKGPEQTRGFEIFGDKPTEYPVQVKLSATMTRGGYSNEPPAKVL